MKDAHYALISRTVGIRMSVEEALNQIQSKAAEYLQTGWMPLGGLTVVYADTPEGRTTTIVQAVVSGVSTKDG